MLPEYNSARRMSGYYKEMIAVLLLLDWFNTSNGYVHNWMVFAVATILTLIYWNLETKNRC